MNAPVCVPQAEDPRSGPRGPRGRTSASRTRSPRPTDFTPPYSEDTDEVPGEARIMGGRISPSLGRPDEGSLGRHGSWGGGFHPPHPKKTRSGCLSEPGTWGGGFHPTSPEDLVRESQGRPHKEENSSVSGLSWGGSTGGCRRSGRKTKWRSRTWSCSWPDGREYRN